MAQWESCSPVWLRRDASHAFRRELGPSPPRVEPADHAFLHLPRVVDHVVLDDAVDRLIHRGRLRHHADGGSRGRRVITLLVVVRASLGWVWDGIRVVVVVRFGRRSRRAPSDTFYR